MTYSVNLAEVITQQMVRFATLNRHQLAGHLLNLDFWLDEIRHALSVIDGYQPRFRKLKEAQEKFGGPPPPTPPSRLRKLRGVPEFFGGTPPLPHRISDSDLAEARRALVDAGYGWLRRCYREGLLTKDQFRVHCESLGTSIDPADLRLG
jgi:hypothetical protein